MKTITFFAYKGGTGRSLLVANVARYMASFGQKVFVLDFDLEAPGLHYKLSDTAEPLKVSQGVVDYFASFQETDQLPSSLADFSIPVPLDAATTGSVRLMPAGHAPTPDYWRKLARLNWHDLFYQPGAEGLALFLELKERIRAEFQPDFLLIDARTGVTEVGGIATTVLPDAVVCLLVNNRENLDGARLVMRGIQRAASSSNPIDIIPVLARYPKEDSDEEFALCQSIHTFLTEPQERLEDTLQVSDIFVLHSDPKLEKREQVLVGNTETTKSSTLLQDYIRLFSRMVPAEAIQPHLAKLIEGAKNAFFDDPDAAQKELETLSEYFGHPDVYRALLQAYRARNIRGTSALQTANALWQTTFDPEDPILWLTIQNCADSLRYWDAETLPLEIVRGMWRRNGSDRNVGLKIAKWFQYKKREDLVNEVFTDISKGNLDTQMRLIAELNKLDTDEMISELRRLS